MISPSVFETILAGVTVFVAGQILLKLIIDPIQELKRTIGRISHALNFYASVYSNPGVGTAESEKEAQKKLRSLSAQLAAEVRVIPVYSFVGGLFFLPSHANILGARKNLIGLSNGVYSKSDQAPTWNIKQAQAVADALSIHIPEDDRIT